MDFHKIPCSDGVLHFLERYLIITPSGFVKRKNIIYVKVNPSDNVSAILDKTVTVYFDFVFSLVAVQVLYFRGY